MSNMLAEDRLSVLSAKIRAGLKRTVAEVIAIGGWLSEAKAELQARREDALAAGEEPPPGYLAWLAEQRRLAQAGGDAGFNLSDSSADNFRQAHALAARLEGRSVKITDYPLGLSELYWLAEPGRTDSEVDTAIARLQSGLPLHGVIEEVDTDADGDLGGVSDEAREAFIVMYAPPPVQEAYEEKRLALIVAYDIAVSYSAAGLPESVHALLERQLISDPEIVPALVRMADKAEGVDILEDLTMHGVLQGAEAGVPLAKANIRDLTSAYVEARREGALQDWYASRTVLTHGEKLARAGVRMVKGRLFIEHDAPEELRHRFEKIERAPGKFVMTLTFVPDAPPKGG